jgi:hypothetical protein
MRHEACIFVESKGHGFEHGKASKCVLPMMPKCLKRAKFQGAGEGGGGYCLSAALKTMAKTNGI